MAKRGYRLKQGTNRVEVNLQTEDRTLVLDAKSGPKEIVSDDPAVWAALEEADGVKALSAAELGKLSDAEAAPRPPQGDTPQPQTESAPREDG